MAGRDVAIVILSKWLTVAGAWNVIACLLLPANTASFQSAHCFLQLLERDWRLCRVLKIHKPMKCSSALHSQQYFFQSFHFITTSLQFIQYLVTCCTKCFPALEMHAASGRFFFSRVKSPWRQGEEHIYSFETPEFEWAPNTRPHTGGSMLSITQGNSRHHHPSQSLCGAGQQEWEVLTLLRWHIWALALRSYSPASFDQQR